MLSLYPYSVNMYLSAGETATTKTKNTTTMKNTMTNDEAKAICKPNGKAPSKVSGMPSDRLAIVVPKLIATKSGIELNFMPMHNGGWSFGNSEVSYYAQRHQPKNTAGYRPDYDPSTDPKRYTPATYQELAQAVLDGHLAVSWGWSYGGV